MKSTTYLSENNRSLLGIALEIARDKFKDNIRVLGSNDLVAVRRLADQFRKQADDAEELLRLIGNADEIIVTETGV